MPKLRSLLVLALAAAVLPGCSKDSTTSPSTTFPTLPAQLLTLYCVRGEKLPGQAISGTLATTDCDLGDGTFYEVWRVRVTTTGTYDFAASSTFDNLLFVLRLDAHTDTSATLTLIDSDDDSGGGTNALITGISLTAGTDYFLLVNGFSATDVGPYTVAFTKP